MSASLVRSNVRRMIYISMKGKRGIALYILIKKEPSVNRIAVRDALQD